MAFLPKDGENNDDESLYSKSGDEDNRLRKEYLYFVQKIHQFGPETLIYRGGLNTRYGCNIFYDRDQICLKCRKSS